MPSIWDYFNRKTSTAVCNFCHKELSLGHESPKRQTCSNIKQHLRKQHPEEWAIFTGGKDVYVKTRKPKKEKLPSPSKPEYGEIGFPKVFVKELIPSEAGDGEVDIDDDNNSLDMLLPQSTYQNEESNRADNIQFEILNVLKDISEDIREQRKTLMETDQELVGCEKKRIRLMEEYVKCYKKQTESLTDYLRRK